MPHEQGCVQDLKKGGDWGAEPITHACKIISHAQKMLTTPLINTFLDDKEGYFRPSSDVKLLFRASQVNLLLV